MFRLLRDHNVWCSSGSILLLFGTQKISIRWQFGVDGVFVVEGFFADDVHNIHRKPDLIGIRVASRRKWLITCQTVMAAAELGQSVDLELNVIFTILFSWWQLNILDFPLSKLILVTRILNLLQSFLYRYRFRLPLWPLKNTLILLGCFIRLSRLSCLTHVIGLHTHAAHSWLWERVLRLFDQPSLIIPRSRLFRSARSGPLTWSSDYSERCCSSGFHEIGLGFFDFLLGHH